MNQLRGLIRGAMPPMSWRALSSLGSSSSPEVATSQAEIWSLRPRLPPCTP